MTEDRKRKTEDRGRRTNDRWQRTEDSIKTEVGGRRSEVRREKLSCGSGFYDFKEFSNFLILDLNGFKLWIFGFTTP